MKKPHVITQMEDFSDLVPVALLAVNEDFKILLGNSLTQSITPLKREELTGKMIGDGLLCRHRSDNPKGCGYGAHCRQCTLRNVVDITLHNGKRPHKAQAALSLESNKAGDYTTFFVSTMLVDGESLPPKAQEEHREKVCVVSLEEDVTEREKLERKNTRDKKYAEAIIDSSPNAVVTLDPQMRINGWNRKAEELFHFNVEEVLGKNIDDCIACHDTEIYKEAKTFTNTAQSGARVPPTETVRYTKEGKVLDLIVSGSPIYVEGRFEGVVASYTDISRRRRKEREVEALLKEKENLLQEVHHRIKNHMNTISSIISLRSSRIDDARIIGVLDEVQTKMRLMQNIYNSLYTSKRIENVSVSSFLSPLLHDIRLTYADTQSIYITTNIEEIEVSSKQSLPVGIIITELISNSVKHAFKETDNVRIHISIYKDRDNPGFLCIEVSDNGKGMPSEVAEKGEYGFGLTLVKGYTVQFDGSMSIEGNSENDDEGGTTVRVLLKLE